MDIEEYWKIISLIDQGALDECDDEEAVGPVTTELAKKYEAEIDQFQEHLSQTLFAIDGQKWMDQSGEL